MLCVCWFPSAHLDSAGGESTTESNKTLKSSFISLKLLRSPLRLNRNLALELSFPSLAYSNTAVPFAWTFSSQVCARYPAGTGPCRLQEALYRRQQKQFRLSGFPSEIPLPSLFFFLPTPRIRNSGIRKEKPWAESKEEICFLKNACSAF